MRNGIYITKREHEAIAYAIDFLSDAIGSADDKPAKQIDKQMGHLISLLKKSKKQPMRTKRKYHNEYLNESDSTGIY